MLHAASYMWYNVCGLAHFKLQKLWEIAKTYFYSDFVALLCSIAAVWVIAVESFSRRTSDIIKTDKILGKAENNFFASNVNKTSQMVTFTKIGRDIGQQFLIISF